MRLLLLALLLVLGPSHSPCALRQEKDPPDRSPASVALSADGRWALTANATSDTASLVDLSEGKVVSEVAVGKRPFAVAWRGTRAVVTNWLSDSITILDLEPPKMSIAGTVDVGYEPTGVTMDGDRAIVALSGESAVVAVDLRARKVVTRATVGDQPWDVALTPDGKRLAVSCALSMDTRVLDAAKLETLHVVRMRGHNLRRLAVAPDGAWAYVCNFAERGAGTSRDNIDRGWVIASRLSRVPLKEEGPREALSLDTRGQAVGDAESVAVSLDGEVLAVACGGSQELLILRLPLPFVASGGPGDHIDPDLLKDRKRFRRISLEGRPVSAVFTPDGKSVVVANYLGNKLQVVDWENYTVTRTIDLGGPAKPSAARRGEAIFYDASRSFHQWFSCHSCHTDGHTNGGLYDTLNDGKYGNAKKTLSLRGVARTAPYTWHGWQKDLRAALEFSLTKTMNGPKPAAEDLDALLAFVSKIDFVPPRRPSDPESVKRGEAVFKAKNCNICHAPPDYSSAEVYEVGLESDNDAYRGFNPPSLRGVGTRGPWLHDGRGKSLEDVLRKHHAPSKVTGKSDPTDEELRDLIAFLKSL